MAYQETWHGDFARFAVILAGVGKSPHILESGMAAVEDVQPELRVASLARLCHSKAKEHECHCRKRRFKVRVFHETGPPPAPYTSPTMSEHERHHHEEHAIDRAPSALELRVRALEALLTEKGYIDPAALDVLIDEYRQRSGPVMVRKWWRG